MRIATAGVCTGFAMTGVFAMGGVERADRGVRPYGWVASSVVGRDDVGIVPYAPFTDSIS